MSHHFHTIAVVLIAACLPYQATSAAALCTTDTDCMRLCPPDDQVCDGGPSPAGPGQGGQAPNEGRLATPVTKDAKPATPDLRHEDPRLIPNRYKT